MRRLLSLTLAGVGLFAPAVYAQLPGLVSTPLAGGGQSWSLPVQTLVFITSLTFSGHPADDDQLHPHHHRLWSAAKRSVPLPRRQTRFCWGWRCF
jgi:hypothetical protein